MARDRTDLLMLLLVTIWGTAFPALKVLGTSLDPYQITWFRYVPFLVLYGSWLLLRQRATLRRVTARDWCIMALIGFIGVVGYHFPLNWALHGTPEHSLSGAAGAIVVATVPILTLLFATLRKQERWTPLAAFGSLVAFAGVVVVCLRGESASGGVAGPGLLLKAAIALLAPISWALYTVAAKPLIARYGSLFVTGLTLSLGELTVVPVGIRYGLAPLRGLTGEAWFWLLFLAFLSTAAGYAIWSYALKRRKPSEVAVYVYLQPVIAGLVGLVYLKEMLNLWFVGGAVLVMAGVVLVNQARLKAARTVAPAMAAVAQR